MPRKSVVAASPGSPPIVPPNAPPPAWARAYRAGDFPPFGYTADVLGLAVDLETGSLDGLMIQRGQEPFAGHDAWPGGFVDWAVDADARVAALRELREETGQTGVDYLEALDTYDTNGRDPRQWTGASPRAAVPSGVRIVSKAWLALLQKGGRVLQPEANEDAASARWVNVYEYLPWEDLRTADGLALRGEVVAALRTWTDAAPTAKEGALRRERVAQAFGVTRSDQVIWNEERVGDRYHLLFEAGLLEEAWRDRWGQVDLAKLDRPLFGRALAFDHRQMLADALQRLRGKIKYVPATLAALVPAPFTLPDLARACEVIGGRRIWATNFARVVARTRKFRVVRRVLGSRSPEPSSGGGRPAQLYAFEEPIALRRLDPSLDMPWVTLHTP